MRIFYLFLILLGACSYNGHQNIAEQKVFFINPSDGDVVTSPVAIKFGVTGMEIVPAGIDKPESGHHHLLVNVDELPNMKMPIPADRNHLHFGKGQTEVTLELPKGKHTLQLLLGNYLQYLIHHHLFQKK
ncbi:MAG: hypothetical protein Ct9H90mP18_09250 [Gammaproteobacteria bacterium]|nr:MAG: hypothetical protein Ct9H90mP18_09250 [Gammaproteobacteria bacterium]